MRASSAGAEQSITVRMTEKSAAKFAIVSGSLRSDRRGSGTRGRVVFLPHAWNDPKPGETTLRRAFATNGLTKLVPVRQHAHVLAATVLEYDTFTSLVVDLVSLAAGFDEVFFGRFVAIPQ